MRNRGNFGRARASFHPRYLMPKAPTFSSRNFNSRAAARLSVNQLAPRIDARSLITNRVNPHNFNGRIDARSIIARNASSLRGGAFVGRGPKRVFNPPKPPIKIPKVTIKNDRFFGTNNQNPPVTRTTISRVIQNSPMKQNPIISKHLSRTQNKISSIQGFRVEVKGLRSSVVLDDVYVSLFLAN
ncbi:hypothetical protein Ciccas_005931 [Cichlidogyrus casuarinus]|uniref:Uncharacterized protein n=1 Tax=Cichlidogyrus casuarinus TaxID=1844966 RepID=A0ABD2Q793_9PLAT